MFGPAWRPTEAVRIVRFNGWRRVQRAASAPVETVQLPRVERGSLFHSIPCLPNLQALRLSQSSGGALGGSRCGGQKPGRLEVGQSEARLHDEDRRGGRMQNDHGRAGGGGGRPINVTETSPARTKSPTSSVGTAENGPRQWGGCNQDHRVEDSNPRLPIAESACWGWCVSREAHGTEYL